MCEGTSVECFFVFVRNSSFVVISSLRSCLVDWSTRADDNDEAKLDSVIQNIDDVIRCRFAFVCDGRFHFSFDLAWGKPKICLKSSHDLLLTKTSVFTTQPRRDKKYLIRNFELSFWKVFFVSSLRSCFVRTFGKLWLATISKRHTRNQIRWF